MKKQIRKYLIYEIIILLLISAISGCTALVCAPVILLSPDQTGECFTEMFDLDMRIIKGITTKPVQWEWTLEEQ